MHRLIKIRVRRDLERLEDRMRGVKYLWLGLEQPDHVFRPAADFYETADGLVLRLEVAGVSEADLSVVLTGQELTIRGRRRLARPADLQRYLQHEIISGDFERSFTIPIAIDPQGVEARFALGILEVRLPRPAPQQRRITVVAANEAGSDNDKDNI
jgi:HSP20 family protein